MNQPSTDTQTELHVWVNPTGFLLGTRVGDTNLGAALANRRASSRCICGSSCHDWTSQEAQVGIWGSFLGIGR